MAGLVELAKKAWLEEKERREKEVWEKVVRFVEDVKREFKQRFQVEPDRVVPKSPTEAVVECNGLKFIAKEERFAYSVKINFYLIKQCSKCGKEGYDKYYPIDNLARLGRELEVEFICEECRSSTTSRTHAEEIRDLLEELLVKLGVRFEE